MLKNMVYSDCSEMAGEGNGQIVSAINPPSMQELGAVLMSVSGMGLTATSKRSTRDGVAKGSCKYQMGG